MVKLKEWLAFQGVEVPDLRRATVQTLLADKTLVGPARIALQARLDASRSSTAKLDRYRVCAQLRRPAAGDLSVLWGEPDGKVGRAKVTAAKPVPRLHQGRAGGAAGDPVRRAARGPGDAVRGQRPRGRRQLLALHHHGRSPAAPGDRRLQPDRGKGPGLARRSAGRARCLSSGQGHLHRDREPAMGPTTGLWARFAFSRWGSLWDTSSFRQQR